MISDNRELISINNNFDLYGKFKSQFYGNQSNCISIQENGDNNHYNSLVALQNTLKSICLKQIWAGWTRIFQQSLKNYNCQNYQSKVQQFNPQQNLTLNNTSKYTSIILPLAMKQIDFKKLKYKQYKQFSTTDRQKSPTTERISKYKNQSKILSNMQKNKTKRNQKIPMSVQEVKRQIRVAKLEKMIKKMKKQHQDLMQGKFFFQSNAKSRQQSEIMLYQNEATQLRREIQRYRFHNYQLSQLLIQQNSKYLYNEHKNTSHQLHSQNFVTFQKHKKINSLTPFSQLQIKQKSIMVQSQPLDISQNRRKPKQNSKLYSKQSHTDTKIHKKLTNNELKHVKNFHTIDQFNSTVNDSYHYPKNQQRHQLYMNKIQKNPNNQNIEYNQLKFSKKSCKCCCHHCCKQ